MGLPAVRDGVTDGAMSVPHCPLKNSSPFLERDVIRLGGILCIVGGVVAGKHAPSAGQTLRCSEFWQA